MFRQGDIVRDTVSGCYVIVLSKPMALISRIFYVCLIGTVKKHIEANLLEDICNDIKTLQTR